MTVRPLVSIVLPTHNGSSYLDEAIQSCLEQTYSNWELVIVDDASTDDTPICISKWVAKDYRIRSVRHPENRKLPGALNTGFSLVKGNYLTWISDDNLYRPQALEKMVTFLEAHPEVDVVYTDYTLIDSLGKSIRQVKVRPPQSLALANYVGPSFLYRRTVQEQLGGYSEDLFLAEDYDFWLRASVEFRLEPLHQDCYLYRIHNSSLTSMETEGIRVADAQVLLRNLPQMSQISHEIKTRQYLSVGVRLAEAGQTSAALEAFALIEYCILGSDPDRAWQVLFYGSMGLRSAPSMSHLLDLMPKEDPAAKAFKRQVWSEYHSIRCFEGFRNRDRATVRLHFPKALWYSASWLRNRGLLRIALWAYLPIIG